MSVEVHRGTAALIVAMPHTGTEIPADVEARLVSGWRARKDTDWGIDALYGFARDLGATTIRTTVSRSVIDCNRDPTGASLYPGQATTGLCPVETFDGEPLYRDDGPGAAEIERRRAAFFDPYHAALAAEVERLRAMHGQVVLYDAHAIRSRIPRLFDGRLPQFNVGTDGGRTCDPALRGAVAAICDASGYGTVVDGRFRGGWTTRRYGRPADGVHAIQMELAMRGYMAEPDAPDEGNWPTPVDRYPAVQPILRRVLDACLAFGAPA